MRISKGAAAAPDGGQAGQPAEPAEPDEVAPEPLDMSFPKSGVRKQCTYLLLFPIIFPLWLTLPDTRRKSCESATDQSCLLLQGGASEAVNGNGAAAVDGTGGGDGEDDAPPLRPVPWLLSCFGLEALGTLLELWSNRARFGWPLGFKYDLQCCLEHERALRTGFTHKITTFILISDALLGPLRPDPGLPSREESCSAPLSPCCPVWRGLRLGASASRISSSCPSSSHSG